MNLRQLVYLRAVAQLKSFAKAARALNVTQPTLSTAIAQLEDELGVRVLERTTRSVRITESGALLMPAVLDVLDARDALLARARALVTPERLLLRIGVSPLVDMRRINAMIEPVLFGNPRIEVVFRQMNLLELYDALEQDKLDFIIGPQDPTTAPHRDWGLAPLYREPLCYIERQGAAQNDGGAITLAEMVGETLVMAPDVCGLSRTTRALFSGEGLTPREYAGQAMSYGILQEWAELGIGAAILPVSKISAPSRVAPRPIIGAAGHAVTIGFNLVWRQRQTARLATLRQSLLKYAPVLEAEPG